jgi:uncharacterized protein (TIGR02996 family)
MASRRSCFGSREEVAEQLAEAELEVSKIRFRVPQHNLVAMAARAAANPFLEAILAAPEDDTSRLIYADWLEERGDPRAEFIRLQCARAQLKRDDPFGYHEATLREKALLEAHRRKWTGLPPCLAEDLVFHRGMIEEYSTWSLVDYFITHAPALFCHPIRGAGFKVLLDEDIEDLCRCPYLAYLRELGFDRCVGARGINALARCRHLAGLTSLFIGDGESCFEDTGVRSLVNSPYLKNLTDLRLGFNCLGPAAAQAVASSPSMVGLRYLMLMGNYIEDAGIQALAASPFLVNLESLVVDYCDIGDTGVAALAASSTMDHLTLLDLSNNRISDRGAKALVDSPFLSRLTHLNLTGNALLDEKTKQELRIRFGNRVRLTSEAQEE